MCYNRLRNACYTCVWTTQETNTIGSTQLRAILLQRCAETCRDATLEAGGSKIARRTRPSRLRRSHVSAACVLENPWTPDVEPHHSALCPV